MYATFASLDMSRVNSVNKNRTASPVGSIIITYWAAVSQCITTYMIMLNLHQSEMRWNNWFI